MDSLLLSFTPEQYKKYLELKESEDISLDFDTTVPNFSFADFKIADITNKMADEGKKLLDLYETDSFFAPVIKDIGISKIASSYFGAIQNIEALRKILFERADTVSNNILTLNREYQTINTRYIDFVPYKAAFGESDKYGDEIIRIDGEFKNSLSKLKEKIKEESLRFDSIILVCDKVVPDFYKSISKAADAPKFKKFDEKGFFAIVEGFIERVRSI